MFYYLRANLQFDFGENGRIKICLKTNVLAADSAPDYPYRNKCNHIGYNCIQIGYNKATILAP